jgi:hypothetical protein
MKLDLLKKLIKEAVKEAVREELAIVLSEDAKPASKTPTVQHVTKYAEHRPVVAKPIPTGNPIMDLMNETKHSMTQGEYQNLISATSDMVQAPGLGMNPITENFRQGPEPGLDISQFDFVNKAAAVYNASMEKDKQRFGA